MQQTPRASLPASNAVERGRLRRACRVGALLVVALSFALAIFGVRRAMQARRVRAERAWSDVAQCVLGHPLGSNESSASRLAHVRQALFNARGASSWPAACVGTAHAAQRAVLELPEHARRELELAAALGEVADALETANDTRLARALDRALSEGSMFGWHAGVHRNAPSAPPLEPP